MGRRDGGIGATLITRDRAIRMFDPKGTLW
jgi:hypothetical protein